jgi:hypothetical protein
LGRFTGPLLPMVYLDSVLEISIAPTVICQYRMVRCGGGTTEGAEEFGPYSVSIRVVRSGMERYGESAFICRTSLCTVSLYNQSQLAALILAALGKNSFGAKCTQLRGPCRLFPQIHTPFPSLPGILVGLLIGVSSLSLPPLNLGCASWIILEKKRKKKKPGPTSHIAAPVPLSLQSTAEHRGPFRVPSILQYGVIVHPRARDEIGWGCVIGRFHLRTWLHRRWG